MPDTGTVYAAIGGLIMVMLAIIGYLISTGFEGLKNQLKIIWEKIDAHQTAAESNRVAIAEINIRCEERHAQRTGTDRRKPHE